MPIQAYAAKSACAPLEIFQYDEKKLEDFDIEIEITHCGICHSDVHLIDNDWQISEYPLVPGHEIVGKVAKLGTKVKHLGAGDRVGVGWQCSSCHTCEFCLRGDENLCAENQATCLHGYGGFAERIIVDSRFAFVIPDSLDSENAAPLLCGGITVYSPLKEFQVQAHHKVGVIGIGGLGHLALQYASKMGCEVTAFSSQADKEAEAKAFGAHHFVNSTDPEALESKAASFDFIINTAHANLDWNSYINTLRPDGTLCFVGVPSEPLQLPIFLLLAGRKRIVASPIGSPSRIQEMLGFSARQNIVAQTELVKMSEVNAALDRVRSNQAKYRVVLENQ